MIATYNVSQRRIIHLRRYGPLFRINSPVHKSAIMRARARRRRAEKEQQRRSFPGLKYKTHKAITNELQNKKKIEASLRERFSLVRPHCACIGRWKFGRGESQISVMWVSRFAIQKRRSTCCYLDIYICIGINVKGWTRSKWPTWTFSYYTLAPTAVTTLKMQRSFQARLYGSILENSMI